MTEPTEPFDLQLVSTADLIDELITRGGRHDLHLVVAMTVLDEDTEQWVQTVTWNGCDHACLGLAADAVDSIQRDLRGDTDDEEEAY